MAPSYVRQGLNWLLGKKIHQKGCEALEPAAQRSTLVTISEGI